MYFTSAKKTQLTFDPNFPNQDTQIEVHDYTGGSKD